MGRKFWEVDPAIWDSINNTGLRYVLFVYTHCYLLVFCIRFWATRVFVFKDNYFFNAFFFAKSHNKTNMSTSCLGQICCFCIYVNFKTTPLVLFSFDST